MAWRSLSRRTCFQLEGVTGAGGETLIEQARSATGRRSLRRGASPRSRELGFPAGGMIVGRKDGSEVRPSALETECCRRQSKRGKTGHLPFLGTAAERGSCGARPAPWTAARVSLRSLWWLLQCPVMALWTDYLRACEEGLQPGAECQKHTSGDCWGSGWCAQTPSLSNRITVHTTYRRGVLFLGALFLPESLFHEVIFYSCLC